VLNVTLWEKSLQVVSKLVIIAGWVEVHSYVDVTDNTQPDSLANQGGLANLLCSPSQQNPQHDDAKQKPHPKSFKVKPEHSLCEKGYLSAGGTAIILRLLSLENIRSALNA